MQTPSRAEMIELIAAFLASSKTPASIFDVSRVVERRFGEEGSRRVRWALKRMEEQGMLATELMTLTRYKLRNEVAHAQ